jgi:4-nitrophenyl phosphatase
MGLTAPKVAMVGDSIASDIIGGRGAGMFTIWIDPAKTAEVPDCVDLRVSGLDELHRLWRGVL